MAKYHLSLKENGEERRKALSLLAWRKGERAAGPVAACGGAVMVRETFYIVI